MSSAEAFLALLLAVCGRQQHDIDRLSTERAVLVEENRALVAERDELRRRLGLNSTNSSKPPSSDGLKRKRRTARSPERERRKRLGRKPGKQKGAPGHHLAMTSRPDCVVELLPAICEKCSGSLTEHAGEEGLERRQVMDPPPPSGLETTEYRAILLRCAECGHVSAARAASRSPISRASSIAFAEPLKTGRRRSGWKAKWRGFSGCRHLRKRQRRMSTPMAVRDRSATARLRRGPTRGPSIAALMVAGSPASLAPMASGSSSTAARAWRSHANSRSPSATRRSAYRC